MKEYLNPPEVNFSSGHFNTSSSFLITTKNQCTSEYLHSFALRSPLIYKQKKKVKALAAKPGV